MVKATARHRRIVSGDNLQNHGRPTFAKRSADFDRAIGLDPKDVIDHYNRGKAYLAKGDLDRATADYDQAVTLDPNYALAYSGRGHAFAAGGDLNGAIAAGVKATELDPKNGRFRENLGIWRYEAGDYTKASADLARSIELGGDVYATLFRFLARARSGQDTAAELQANASRFRTTEWPYAVVELYLGKRTTAATLGNATNPDQKCEAQYYIGQWLVLKSDKISAKAAFHSAAETCPKNFDEYAGALAELKRI